MKGLFASNHAVGTGEWGLDGRRLISDLAKSISELVSLPQNINLEARRVRFVVFSCWPKSHEVNLSALVMGAQC